MVMMVTGDLLGIAGHKDGYIIALIDGTWSAYQNQRNESKKKSTTPRTSPKLIISHQSRLLSKSLEPRLAASALES